MPGYIPLDEESYPIFRKLAFKYFGIPRGTTRPFINVSFYFIYRCIPSLQEPIPIMMQILHAIPYPYSLIIISELASQLGPTTDGEYFCIFLIKEYEFTQFLKKVLTKTLRNTIMLIVLAFIAYRYMNPLEPNYNRCSPPGPKTPKFEDVFPIFFRYFVLILVGYLYDLRRVGGFIDTDQLWLFVFLAYWYNIIEPIYESSLPRISLIPRSS